MKLWLAGLLLRWGNRLDTPTARAQREALNRYLTARAFQRLRDGDEFRREIEAEYGLSPASRRVAPINRKGILASVKS